MIDAAIQIILVNEKVIKEIGQEEQSVVFRNGNIPIHEISIVSVIACKEITFNCMFMFFSKRKA